MKYYFNPSYALTMHENQALITVRNPDVDPKFNINDSITTVIHPLQAIILTFFKGEEYDECINKASAYLNIDKNQVKKFTDNLVFNSTILSLKENGSTFPINTIVSTENHDNSLDIEVDLYRNQYNPDTFYFDSSFVMDYNIQRTSHPLSVEFQITSRCSTNCIYCYEDRSIKKNIPLDKIKEIVLECKNLGVTNLIGIGGDMYTHPDGVEVSEFFYKNGYKTALTTKKPINEEDVKVIASLKNYGLTNFQISLDTLIPKVSKKLISSGKNYVENIISTMNYFDKHDVPLVIHSIMTNINNNIEDLKSIYKVIKDLNISVIWNVDPVFETYYSSLPWSELDLKIEDRKKLSDYLEVLKQDCAPNVSINNSLKITSQDVAVSNKIDCNVDEITSKIKAFEGNATCPANRTHIAILGNGDVTTCLMLGFEKRKFIIGNVYENTISEIWNGEKAIMLSEERRHRKSFFDQNLEQKEISPCYSCPLFETCEGLNFTCVLESIEQHGADKWDYPHLSCPVYQKTLAMEKETIQ